VEEGTVVNVKVGLKVESGKKEGGVGGFV